MQRNPNTRSHEENGWHREVQPDDSHRNAGSKEKAKWSTPIRMTKSREDSV
jgi:hypothetical protein